MRRASQDQSVRRMSVEIARKRSMEWTRRGSMEVTKLGSVCITRLLSFLFFFHCVDEFQQKQKGNFVGLFGFHHRSFFPPQLLTY